MVNGANAKKIKKATAIVSCLVMCLVSVTPAYAATEVVAQAQEKWLDATFTEREEAAVKSTSVDELTEMAADTDVTEIDLTQSGVDLLITTVTLDYTIQPGMRVLYRHQKMTAGESLSIMAICEDESITYRIGLKNNNTGVLRYVQGTGVLSHTFEITEDGQYTAYVENKSSVAMEVRGSAFYPD